MGYVPQLQCLQHLTSSCFQTCDKAFADHRYPAYGYNCAATAENNAALQSLATAARTAIAGVSGTAYTIGKSCSTLYATTGSSVDYVDATGNATYSYTYELRDRGTYGFVLPANQINPTAVETWAGVLAMLQRA